MYFISFWSSIVIFIVISLFGPFLINYIFNNNFLNTLNIFKISTLAIVFVGLSTTYTKVLYKNDLHKYLFFKSILGIFICVIFNLFFIPGYGVIGVCYATILSMFISEIIIDFFIKDLRKHHITKLKSIFYFKTIKL